MNAKDRELLLKVTQLMTEARLMLGRMSAEGRAELTKENRHLFSELEATNDKLDARWLDARRAAAALGSIKSPRKAETSAENGKRPVKPGSNPRGRPRKQTN